MTIETWLAFLAASAILVAIPGPTVLLVLSYALGQGWRTALPMAIGVALGDFTAMTFSLLGLGALLATSATIFTLLKWLGACYLVWLGIKLWRAGDRPDSLPERAPVAAGRMAFHAWAVTALNPKSLTFFIAFLPQFLDPAGDFWMQMLIFEASFLALAFGNVLLYVLLAARLRGLLGRGAVLRLVHRLGGGLLIGAGIAGATLTSRL